MKIIKITLTNYHEFIVVAKSIDKGCKDLLDYFEKEDIYFAFERKIKDIEIIAEKVDIDDYENIYKTI